MRARQEQRWRSRPIDGERLAQLMIDHEVGVSLRKLSIPSIDSDYFEG